MFAPSDCTEMAAPHPPNDMPLVRHRTRSSASLADGDKDGERQSKRARVVEIESAKRVPRHFVVAFDEPYRHLEVSLSMLRDYSCRTASMMERDPPVGRTVDGHPVWRVPYTHAAVKCWVRAMTFGELDLGSDVSMSEILSLLEYEGIDAPSDLIESFHEIETAKKLQLGLWSSEKGSLQVSVRNTAESVADALVRWPRIVKGLRNVASGVARPGFTCSATRVWVRFAPRPQLRHQYDGKRDALYEYCAQKPRPPAWLTRTLRLLGLLYCSLPNAQRTVSCFNKMDELVQQRLKTWFTQEPPCNSDALPELRKFTHEILSTTYAAGPRVGRNAGMCLKDTNEELLFARACISLAEWIVENQTALDIFFSGACADEKGDTAERTALARALKARKARVVRWAQEPAGVTPLIFPPVFAEDSSDSGDLGPSVLLSFEGHV